ncbi:hypothetical protein KXD40_009209 [Peronospora effusa]|nr:hypothetical protein KXD40_009209 [Peronospora effusa]
MERGAGYCRNTKWDNEYRGRRTSGLKNTRTGIGVVATRPIPAGGVVCQYWGQYVLDPPRGAAYTVDLRQRDTKGHRVYVSVEECGSVARIVERSCIAKPTSMRSGEATSGRVAGGAIRYFPWDRGHRRLYRANEQRPLVSLPDRLAPERKLRRLARDRNEEESRASRRRRAGTTK